MFIWFVYIYDIVLGVKFLKMLFVVDLYVKNVLFMV